jgi:hypothetical protein
MTDGGPAFPINANESADRCIYTGMTLRDYFAAKAMQGDWAAGNAEDDLCVAAARYYYMADAMLKERLK